MKKKLKRNLKYKKIKKRTYKKKVIELKGKKRYVKEINYSSSNNFHISGYF